MNKKERAAAAVERLEKIYPAAECALRWEGDPWRLLVMGRLSAQCTDARVNIVCEELFKKYPDVYSMAEADVHDVENYVRPCGLFRTKAANIVDSARMIALEHGGKVPDSMEDLLRLPGVGRKIANLILGDVYNKPAIVADTHCIRISARLGLTARGEKDPVKTERELRKLIPPEKSSDFCHRIVQFGRDTCSARSPACGTCPLADICAAAFA